MHASISAKLINAPSRSKIHFVFLLICVVFISDERSRQKPLFAADKQISFYVTLSFRTFITFNILSRFMFVILNFCALFTLV